MSQYFFPAIIYRDIISHITITYMYIMYFFRTFKKSTVLYKVHNMGLRYIKNYTLKTVYIVTKVGKLHFQWIFFQLPFLKLYITFLYKKEDDFFITLTKY
jgi:hypothetical protein